MEWIIRTVFLLALCAAPIPSYAWLARRLSAPSMLSHFLLLTVYWVSYLTGIALAIGHTGTLSNQTVSRIVLLSYLPLLIGPCRSACIQGIRKSLSIASRLSSDHFYLSAATFALLSAFAYLLGTNTTRDYDSMAYHVPFVFQWIQDQRFTIHPQFSRELIGYYPSNWEALCTLFALVHHLDLLLLAPNVLALLLLILSLVGIGRTINIPDRATWSAGLLCFSRKWKNGGDEIKNSRAERKGRYGDDSTTVYGGTEGSDFAGAFAGRQTGVGCV